MKRADLEKAINFLNIDMKSISTTMGIIITGLFNIIETIFQDKEELQKSLLDSLPLFKESLKTKMNSL